METFVIASVTPAVLPSQSRGRKVEISECVSSEIEFSGSVSNRQCLLVDLWVDIELSEGRRARPDGINIGSRLCNSGPFGSDEYA
jgi:hypothetical protein